MKLHPNSTLSPAQYRKLAVGAVYGVQQEAFTNTLATGLPLADIGNILVNWWGIDSKHSAREKLVYLRDKGFRFYLPTVYQAYLLPSDEVQEAWLPDQFEEDEDIEKAFSQLVNLEETYEELQVGKIIKTADDIPRLGVVGWDVGRLIFVTRLSFDAMYITEDDAWELIDQADVMAREAFTSWHDLGRSYVLGRSLWGGIDCDNTSIMAVAKELEKDPASPWVQLAW
jgi:Protein of unknown function (DUF1266)